MSTLSRFAEAVGRMFGGAPGTTRSAPRPPAPTRAIPASFVTVQVDPSVAADVPLTYTPHPDSRPDPGEVVWTWVPYEENDGRGKDRPVLVLARLSAASVLAIQLTSKSHEGDSGSLALGAGAWDDDGRPSWARIDRLFRVYDVSMRREGSALDSARYAIVAKSLASRYRW